jgi:uncharacterized protein (DUF1015 family)
LAIIAPFRGVRYNPEFVPDLSQVIAPPYDVISSSECEALYAQHPQNVARLILGKEGLANHEKTGFYQTAANLYRQWLQQGFLKPDQKPAVYVVDQTFALFGAQHTRRGFMARILLEEFGKGSIHPHEETISAPKADRLRLMRACHANFSPIFGLYPDDGSRVTGLLAEATRREPDASAQDREGVEVNIWRLDDPGLCVVLADLLRDKPIFIADGHHRYETAITYRNETRGGDSSRLGDKPCDWTMMTCVALEDAGLVILPTHRVVRKGSSVRPADVLQKLERDFVVDREPAGVEGTLNWMRLSGEGMHRFGMYCGERNQCFRLQLRPKTDLAENMPRRGEAWQNLGVSILHYLVIGDVLGIPFESLGATKEIEYFKDAEKAAKAVRGEVGGFAFFLNPTPISALQAVASARETMPPKSTYFYPKLVTGLVINPLE